VLLAGEAVDSVFGAVSVDPAAVVGEPLLDRIDGGERPRIGGGQKSDNRHHQVGGVQCGPADLLGERARCLAPPVPYHGLPDLTSFSELASGVTFAIVGAPAILRRLAER
jgi:hypothetical protein